MIEHNKNFYSLEELKRTKDSLEGYLDNEEVYYFVGAIRYACDEIERLNNIINELEKSKEKQINEYEILILKIERYLNCYQYFLETQEENNKKIANMIHEFSLGSNNNE